MDMVLFPFPDREILILSGVFDKRHSQRVVEELELELKLQVFMLPADDFIVITPSSYLESPICRELIHRNIAFVQDGYMRLLRREHSNAELIEKKQVNYFKVRSIEDYKAAYFSNTDYGLTDIGFAVVAKAFSTGNASLNICLDETRIVAQKSNYDLRRIDELSKRLMNTESNAFLWESTQPQLKLAGIQGSDEQFIHFRDAMTKSYLQAHSSVGIVIPSCSSGVISQHFGDFGGERQYNSWAIRRILSVLGVFDYIKAHPAGQIIKIKQRANMMALIEAIRLAIKQTNTSEDAIRQLKNNFSISEINLGKLGINSSLNQTNMQSNKKVFVIHGRNLKIRDAMYSFLQSLGLEPQEWGHLMRNVKSGSPFIGDIIDSGIRNTSAVIALFTPDESATLKRGLCQQGEQAKQGSQPRPNVFIETGMALGVCPEKTIIVHIGNIRPISDLDGRYVIRFNGDDAARHRLVQRLKDVGCIVDNPGDGWLKAGTFSIQ